MCEWHQISVSVAGRSPARIVDQGPLPSAPLLRQYLSRPSGYDAHPRGGSAIPVDKLMSEIEDIPDRFSARGRRRGSCPSPYMLHPTRAIRACGQRGEFPCRRQAFPSMEYLNGGRDSGEPGVPFLNRDGTSQVRSRVIPDKSFPHQEPAIQRAVNLTRAGGLTLRALLCGYIIWHVPYSNALPCSTLRA